MTSDGFPHHSVLSHKYDSHTSQTHSDLLHLFRANIVCTHDETLWVVIQKLLHSTHSFHHTLKLMTKYHRRSLALIRHYHPFYQTWFQIYYPSSHNAILHSHSRCRWFNIYNIQAHQKMQFQASTGHL